MFEQFKEKARNKMEETLNFLQRDLASISAGRANPDLLNTIKVNSYGNLMPINQVASVSVPDSTTLSIQAWDKDSIKSIEKAIIESNLGFNPMSEGQIIRISIPKLSEERRIELSKLAKKYGEDKKIAIRNTRRDILDEFKKADSSTSKDQIHEFTNIIQEVTDEFTKKIDNKVSLKDSEIMKV